MLLNANQMIYRLHMHADTGLIYTFISPALLVLFLCSTCVFAQGLLSTPATDAAAAAAVPSVLRAAHG